MGLAAGTRLGPYEIAGPLGAGGMGEVYRARDTKLGRDVAIKVLPAVFADDAARMARFEREAGYGGVEPSEHRGDLRGRAAAGDVTADERFLLAVPVEQSMRAPFTV